MRQLKDLGLIIAYELHGFRIKLVSLKHQSNQMFLVEYSSVNFPCTSSTIPICEL